MFSKLVYDYFVGYNDCKFCKLFTIFFITIKSCLSGSIEIETRPGYDKTWTSIQQGKKTIWGLKQYLTMIWCKVGAITDFQTSFGSALSENLSPNEDRFITCQGSS